MPYNASIPNPGDLLSVSQGDIRNNFTTANASFGIDHTAFDVNVNPGYHKVVHLLPQAGVPVVVAAIGELYCRQVTSTINDTALFYQTGTGLNIQMTVNVVPSQATNGYSFLPGGLLIQWGNVAVLSSGVNVVNFPIAFDSTGTPVNNVYAITTASTAATGSAVSAVKLSNTQFHLIRSGTGTGASWMAIGRAQT